MSQHFVSERRAGLSRRAFIGGALATGAALALAGCGEKQSSEPGQTPAN